MTTKVISARIDEEAAALMDRVTEFLGITKRQFLEEAIRMRAREDEKERVRKAIEDSWGAWKRDEPPEETIRQMKEARRAGQEARNRRLGLTKPADW
jgi:antitoxin component of RelBE/YafQ-DinJ toxin-antitoxin module